MSKYKRILKSMILLIVTLILCFSTKSYAEQRYVNAGELLGANVQGWFCAEMSANSPVNGYYEYRGQYTYSTGDTDKFKRAFTLLMKHAKENNDLGFGHKQWGDMAGGLHQKALWHLLAQNRSGNYGKYVPFNLCLAAETEDFNNEGAWGVSGLKDLYNNIRTQAEAQVPYSATKAEITTSKLKMTDSKNGSIKINKLSGKVSSIVVRWEDGKESTLSGYGSDSACKFFNSNKSNKKNISVYDMQKNKTYYIENYHNSKIKQLQINVTSGGGSQVTFELYTCGANQNVIHITDIKNSNQTTASPKVEVEYSRELTVIKEDYTTAEKLNGAEFAIFQGGKGWLGYDENEKKVTYGKSFSARGKFITGTSYCGLTATKGQFTLNGLELGDYYVFEIEPAKGYEKLFKYGWNDDDGGNILSGNKSWAIPQNVPRVLIGNKRLETLKERLTNRVNSNPTSDDWEAYDEIVHPGLSKKLWDVKVTPIKGETVTPDSDHASINENTKKATFRVRNKKGGEGIDAKLTIRKRDYDGGTALNGFKFAIFKYNEGWLGYKDGKVTYGNSWANSQAFVTGTGYCGNAKKDGEFSLSKLTYGYYYVFEIGTNGDYSLMGQQGYSKSTGNSIFTKNEWKMLDKDENEVPRILCGGSLWKKNLVNVNMMSGSYDFRFEEKDDKGSKAYIRLANQKGKYTDSKGVTKYATKEATYTIKNRKDTNIKVVKTDSETGAPIEGVGIKLLVNLREHIYGLNDKQERKDLYNVGIAGDANAIAKAWYWVYEDSKGNYSLTKDHTKATEFKTSANGELNLIRLPYGIYHIYETKPAKGYTLADQKGYKKAKPATHTTKDTFFDGEYVELSSKTINKNNRTYEIPVTNTPELTKLVIKKIDGSYKETMGAKDDLSIAGAEMKIYGTNLKGDKKSGWVKQVKEDKNIRTEYVDYANATTFKTDENGMIEVDKLKQGTYYIFETKLPNGYDIKQQKGYKTTKDGNDTIPGTAEIKDNDWVYLGKAETKVNSQTKSTTSILLKNEKYVAALKGKVWVDFPDKKANGFDHIYDPNTDDELLKDIQVNLYSNKEQKVIATTKTNEKGEYFFDKKADGNKLTYWDIAYCHVEFMYDNTKYVIVKPFVGDNLQVNSKAQEKEVITTGGEYNMGELYDGNLTGLEGNFPGRAVTYQGATSGLDFNKIEANKKLSVDQRLLTSFYHDETYTVEDINFGLMEKLNPSFEIGQQIEYVKIKRGNYTFTYKMGDDFVINMEDGTKETQARVAYQNSARTFSQALYPSDIKYNFANNSDDKFRVYIVYRIMVNNNTTHNIQDLYKETSLHLSSLTDEFDKTRYELSTEVMNILKMTFQDGVQQMRVLQAIIFRALEKVLRKA